MDRLFVLLAVLGSISSVSGLIIKVSQQNGGDNDSCLTSNASRPCKTLQYALKALSHSSDTSLRLEILDDYILKDEVSIHDGSRARSVITITSGTKRVNVTCDEAGIFNISDSQNNVVFADLNFQDSSPDFAAVVLLWSSRNVTFHRCTFRNNRRACINAFNSNVVINDCVFLNNTSNACDVIEDERFVPGNVSASGGVAFVFRGDARDLEVKVTRSNFSFNKAVVNNSEDFIDHLYNVSHFTNGGGGILIVFSGSTENCNVTIDDVQVFNNSASYGGGIYVAADNESKNNRFLLDRSELFGNQGSQAGGAMGITQWDHTTSTSVVLCNSTFKDNWSRRGGGINVFFNNLAKTLCGSELILTNVLFTRNRGNSSAALRLASSLPLGAPIPAANIFNCSFVGHAQTERFAFTAPFTSQKVNIVFKGHNVFKRNTDAGAAEFMNTILHVHDKLEFVENTGVQGGAIVLRSSQIKLHPSSEVYFAHNQADTMGGAVAVLNHMMYEVIKMFNPDCFLVYSQPYIPPSKWKVNISFVNNRAKLKGAAIYIASLFACLWDERPPHTNISRALRWNSTRFKYKGNYLDTGENRETCNENEAIATDTANFKIMSPDKGSSTFKLAPGEELKIQIQGFDQLNHEVYTVASLSKENRSSPLVLNNSMHVLVPSTNNTISLKYSMKQHYYEQALKDLNTSYKVEVTDAYSTFDNQYLLEFQVQPCPPGFNFSKVGGECICGTADGVLRCEEGRYVILKNGYWANVSKSGRLITYYCPYEYCGCNESECKVDLSHPDMQCKHNRIGKLCGHCPANYSVGLRWYNCVEDCYSGWILGVVIGVVAFLSIFIIWLNPSISSELRGPLFFFQALPIIFPPHTTVWRDVINVLANTFNFGGPIVFLHPHWCILNGITNLHMVAIGYVMPLVTLGIFILSYVLSANYLVRLRFRARSSLHSFWLLMLFVYHYLVETTFLLLNCPKVGDDHVFYYDGSIKCFSKEHAGMAALALVVLFVFIIPPPIIIVLLTKGCWRVDPQYVSTLTNGLRPQCQWWWAFELVRRILLVATYVFFSHWTTKQVAISVMCVFILTVHSNMQPYRRARINAVESCYLFALSAMAIFQIIDSVPLSVYVTLLVVATLHTLVLFLYKSYRFCKKRFGRRDETANEEVRTARYGSLQNVEENSSVQNIQHSNNEDVLDAIFGKSERGDFKYSGSE